MPYANQIQYPARVLGLGPPTPVTSVDKWYFQHPGPTVNRLTVAAIAAGLMQCSIPPTVRSPAEWMPREQPACPVRTAPRPPGIQVVAPLLAIGPKPDAFVFHQPDSALVAQPRPQGIQVTDPLLVMVPPRPEAWMPRPIPDLPLVAPPRPQGWQVIDPQIVPNPPRADMWEYPPVIPTVPPRQPGWFTIDALLVPKPPKPEAWAQPQQANPLAAKRAPEFGIGGNWTATQQAAVTFFYADAWQAGAQLPVFPTPRQQGWITADALYVPNPPKAEAWAQARQPNPAIKRVADFGIGGNWAPTQTAQVTFFYTEAWQFAPQTPPAVPPARQSGQQIVAPLQAIGPKPDAFVFHQPDMRSCAAPRPPGWVAMDAALVPNPSRIAQFQQPFIVPPQPVLRQPGQQLVDPHYVLTLPRVDSWQPMLSQPKPRRTMTWIYGADVRNVTFVPAQTGSYTLLLLLSESGSYV